MRNRRAGLMFVAVLLGARPALAAPGLSMDEAVGRALARAPELAAVRENEAAAVSRVTAARTAYWPRVAFEARYAVHWEKAKLPIDLSGLQGLAAIIPNFQAPKIADIDDYHAGRVGAGASIRLLDFSRGSRVDSAQSSLAAEKARSRETAAALAFQVRASFLAALLARDLKQIAGESLKLALAEERREALRVEVGTGSQLGLAQSRVRVASLRAQLRNADNELERQRRLLASLLGADERALPDLRGELHALAGPLPRRGLAEVPALERLRHTQQAAEQSARSIDRTFWPTLSVTARADYEYPHAFKLEWGPLLQGGVSLGWDLFDGGLRRAQVAEARAGARGLAEQATATEESLRRRLIDVEARTRTAEADLLSAREILEQTEVYLRVARGAVAAGTGTQLDVHNAELGVDRAKVAVQQALLGKALARAEGLMVHGIAAEGGSREGPSGFTPMGGGGRQDAPRDNNAGRRASRSDSGDMR
jgi:outer membrane protein TolC